MKSCCVLVMATCLIIAGCASSADEVKPSYVSPLAYKSYGCKQISQEAQRVARRAEIVAGAQDKNATNDAVVTGIAIVVFWPAAFFVEGDGQTAAELGRLKGELEALEKASIKRGCNIKFNKTRGMKNKSKSVQTKREA